MHTICLTIRLEHPPVCPGCYRPLGRDAIYIQRSVAICVDCKNMYHPRVLDCLVVWIDDHAHPHHFSVQHGIIFTVRRSHDAFVLPDHLRISVGGNWGVVIDPVPEPKPLTESQARSLPRPEPFD